MQYLKLEEILCWWLCFSSLSTRCHYSHRRWCWSQSEAMDFQESATQTESCLTAITDISTAKHSADLQFSVAAFVKRQTCNTFLMNIVTSVNGNAGVVKSKRSWKLWFRSSKNSKQLSELAARTEEYLERERERGITRSLIWPWRHWD